MQIAKIRFSGLIVSYEMFEWTCYYNSRSLMPVRIETEGRFHNFMEIFIVQIKYVEL